MTIPQLLDEPCARHGARDAAIFDAEQRCAVLVRPAAQRRRGRGRAARARPQARRPRRHLGAEPARVAASRSSARRASARSWSTSIRPIAMSELEYALNKVGCRVLVMARALKSSDYVAMLRASSRRRSTRARQRGGSTASTAAASASTSSLLGDGPLPPRALHVFQMSCALGGPAQRARLDALVAPRSTPTTRSTSSSPAARPARRRARRLPTSTSSTTRATAPRRWRSTAQRPALHPGAALPLLRHGAGRAVLRRRRARRWSFPARASTPRRRCRRSRAHRCTALHGVPTMFIADARASELRAATTCRRLRTGIMAGAPCPIETMRRVIARDAHARGHDRLRHDRDQPDLVPVAASTIRSSGASRRSAASSRTSK